MKSWVCCLDYVELISLNPLELWHDVMQHVSLEAKPFGSFRLSVGFIFGFIFTLSFELTFERERDGLTDGRTVDTAT